MAHAITKTVTKTITKTAPIKNDLKYPNDVHALEDKIAELQAQNAQIVDAVSELQTIVAALA